MREVLSTVDFGVPIGVVEAAAAVIRRLQHRDEATRFARSLRTRLLVPARTRRSPRTLSQWLSGHS